jgi:hypothetical protein
MRSYSATILLDSACVRTVSGRVLEMQKDSEPNRPKSFTCNQYRREDLNLHDLAVTGF